MGQHYSHLNLRRTRFVTWPRSGHHWTVDLLKTAMPFKFRYLEHYSDGGSLETHPRHNAQKTHDLQLDVPVSRSYHYVVQVRNFEDSTLSWFKIEPDWNDLETFRNEKREYRDKWMAKWVDGDVPNRLIVRYEEMVEDPKKWLMKVLFHIVRNLPPDTAELLALEALAIHPCKRLVIR